MNRGKDALTLLKDAGAIMEGHFIGISGKHLSGYVNKDAFLPDTEIVSELGKMFAEKYKDKDIEVVVGPAAGGILLSTWTAHHLTKLTGTKVLSVFTEKTGDGGREQILKRSYGKLVSGKRVLAVEDTVTTGGSIHSAIRAVQNAGGDVVQLGLIINRDPRNVTQEAFSVPMSSLAEIQTETFAEDEVPDWLWEIPINTAYGHGAKYVQEYSNVKLP